MPYASPADGPGRLWRPRPPRRVLAAPRYRSTGSRALRSAVHEVWNAMRARRRERHVEGGYRGAQRVERGARLGARIRAYGCRRDRLARSCRSFFQRAREITHLPPVAVFWGDRDTIVPTGHAKAFKAAVDGAVFERFDGCGHYLHQERPRSFVTALRAFLDDPAAVAARLKPTHA